MQIFDHVVRRYAVISVFATGQTGPGGLEAVRARPGRPDVRLWTR